MSTKKPQVSVSGIDILIEADDDTIRSIQDDIDESSIAYIKRIMTEYPNYDYDQPPPKHMEQSMVNWIFNKWVKHLKDRKIDFAVIERISGNQLYPEVKKQ